MTLQDLFDGGVTMQGNIRLSWWKGDEETHVREIRGCEDLSSVKIGEKAKESKIKYIFAPGDGYLHIELKEDCE